MGGVGIDTAYVYFNQKDIAAGLQASGVKRSDVFITTKIPCQSTRAAALGMVKEDLNELNVTFVDLMLIHFPCLTKYGNEQTWLGLQDALEMNLTRAIGVSNFDSSQISDLLALGGVPPAVNQCKMSVLHHDDDTISFCKKNNITYESYSPLKSVDLSDKRIASIAKTHNASGAQVALKWILQQECTVATSPGLNEEFVKEDLSLDRFQLSDKEMETLSKISSSY